MSTLSPFCSEEPKFSILWLVAVLDTCNKPELSTDSSGLTPFSQSDHTVTTPVTETSPVTVLPIRAGALAVERHLQQHHAYGRMVLG